MTSTAARRIRLDLGYDGAAFHGWARQPGLRTVQQVLEDALGTVLRVEAPRVVVGGRTDAGVHARGQVAHLDVAPAALGALRARDGSPPTQVLLRRLAGVLPDDLVVHAASLAPAGFDARFSPVARRYCYRVADDHAARDPLRRGHVLWHPRRLDVTAMAQAAVGLVGLHDFAAYCRPRPGATTVRTLLTFEWVRPTDGPDAGLAVATVEADAFCHSMVRALVGASLAVGEGRRDVGWPRQVRDAGVRAAAVAPAHGLTLEEVRYPPDDELSARADATRARREPVDGC